jgi:hypothetical protein
LEVNHLVREIENLEIENIIVRKYNRNFQIYPWIKSRIFHKVIMGNEVLQEKNKSVFWSQFKSLSYGFFNLFKRYDVWVFTNSSERVLVDNKYWDKSFDFLAKESNLKWLTVELCLFKKYKRKSVASKHVISRSIFIFVEEFYTLLFLRRKPVIEGRKVLDQVQQKLQTTVDTDGIIKKYLAQYRVMKFFLRILPKPKFIFLTVSYANFGYIQAWKEAGIKVIEMQHGLIGEEHYGYFYGKKLNSIQFPDEICVFGDADVRFFQEFTKMPVQKATPLGRSIIDYFKIKASPNRLPIKRIVVSLQDSDWSIELLNFVLECDKIMSNKITWIIQTRRTSASEYQSKYDFPSNFEFSEVSVYEAISKTDAHLTIFSTTSIESLSIGKATFLYNYKNAAKDFLGSFLENNKHVYFCDSVEEFVKNLENLPLISNEEIASSNDDNIVNGYLERSKEYLKKLLNESI